jgi:hypothetical protein
VHNRKVQKMAEEVQKKADFINSGDVAGLSPFGFRRSVRRIVAECKAYSWAQQCLTFELIENIGTTASPGFGRCIRISTVGTLVNTAAFRGDGQKQPPDPYARSLDRQLDWMAKKNKEDLSDNLFVLDDIHFTIEATSPTGEAVNVARQWTLIDASPTTKNGVSSVNTSTTLGFNAGFFGDVPTAGVEASTTTSHEWSMPDYVLFLMGGLGEDQEPRATWHVKRSDPDSDPNIARSSFRPIFEAVFGLRSGVTPGRYSSITTMMTLKFKKIDSNKDKAYLAKQQGKASDDSSPSVLQNIANTNPFVEAALQAIPLFVPDQEGNSDDLASYSFMATFVVDWKNGTVSGYMPTFVQNPKLPPPTDPTPESARLYAVEDSSRDFRNILTLKQFKEEVKNSTGDHEVVLDKDINEALRDLLEPNVAKKLLLPYLPENDSIADLRMEFRDDSSIGLANPDRRFAFSDANDIKQTFDVQFPVDALASYSDQFVIHSGYPVVHKDPQFQWLPFKRAARIQTPEIGSLLWSAPAGYSRDSIWEFNALPDNLSFRQLRSIDVLGLPEVPDSYYRSQGITEGSMWVKEYVAWRDRIFINDGSGWTESASCFSHLTSAVMSTQLSLGIAEGKLVASKDLFKTPLKLDDLKVSRTQENDQVALDIAVNNFLYGSVNVWMFRLDVEVVVVADEQVALFSVAALDTSMEPDKKMLTFEVLHWRTLIDRWSKLEVDKSQKGFDNARRIMTATILAGTGIRKPIIGWAEILGPRETLKLLTPATLEYILQKMV